MILFLSPSQVIKLGDSITFKRIYLLKALSRREFLMRGSAMAYPAMMAMGMLRSAPASGFSLEGSGEGKRIIVLGAGLAGMAAGL